MKTEALWYLGERKIEFRATELADPDPHEVLVEMEVCGLCGWDLVAYSGKFAKFHSYPFRAGHEGLGRIVSAGAKTRGLRVGQRVACQELPIDENGGLLARHALRAGNQVALLPEDSPIPLTRWIVEPVACVVNGLIYAGIRPGDSVALVGSGYMGLLMLQGLRRTLAGRVSVFEPDPRRLELARRFGEGMGNWDYHATGPEAADGGERRAYDVVIETAGAPDSLETALALAKPYAIIENFAWHHHRHEFDLDEWHTKGWRILNIQPQMNPDFGEVFARAVRLVEAGVFTNEGLVTHVAPFARAEEALAAGLDRKGGYIKGVIDFTAG